MTNNQRKAAFLKLLHHYILHTDHVTLCHFISELFNRKLLTKGEATFLRAMISAELDHSQFYLDDVIPKIQVRFLFFFKRWETQRELRIRWIRSQIEKFNV